MLEMPIIHQTIFCRVLHIGDTTILLENSVSLILIFSKILFLLMSSYQSLTSLLAIESNLGSLNPSVMSG